MKIRTLKVIEHKGNKIYVRNFGSTFEYLAVVNGEIYSSHITIKKPLLLLGRDYTPKQLASAIKYLLTMAEATVDYALAPKA